MTELVRDHSDLVDLEVYGKSAEGRDLLLVTVTDKSAGAHSDKPAHWVDGMPSSYTV